VKTGIYLDNAATTLVKPPAVADAMRRAVGTLASPGRGGHPASMRAAEAAFACRQAAAELFHLENPEMVVITSNATHGLNMAIKTLAGPGERVVISGYEHNAVTRPLAALGVRLAVAGTDLFSPEQALRDFEAQITPDTRLVVVCHVSNVFGYALPIRQISALCRVRGVPLVIDAAQSAGILTLDAEALGAAFIAMPGHKGLYGPQGTGLLLCGRTPKPLLDGGTGSDSRSQEMPANLPDRGEAGTHNMPGIAGLTEGLRFVRKKGAAAILAHEQALLKAAVQGLARIQGVHAFSAPEPQDQAGVLSFVVRGMDCEAAAAELARLGVAVRAGLHCAPRAHLSGGTWESGTVRISFSAFNTKRDVDGFLNKLEYISKKVIKL